MRIGYLLAKWVDITVLIVIMTQMSIRACDFSVSNVWVGVTCMVVGKMRIRYLLAKWVSVAYSVVVMLEMAVSIVVGDSCVWVGIASVVVGKMRIGYLLAIWIIVHRISL